MRPPGSGIKLALLCLILATTVQASSELPNAWRYNVRQWSTQDDLPHNKIHDVIQDSEGFIWAATWDGLVRFNGQRFTLFDTRNTPGLRTRGFRALATNAQGDLIAGSARQGPWIFQDGLWSALAPERLDSLWITVLMSDGQQGWWIGTENGLARIDRHGGRLDDWPAGSLIARTWINSVAQDSDGSIMAATEDGLILGITADHPGQAVGNATGLPGTTILTALRLRDGRIVVGSDSGVYASDGRDGPFRRIAAIPGVRIDGLLQDGSDAVWINTSDEGLILWNGDDYARIDEAMGLRGRATRALMQDREGLIWAGTADGLARIADGVATTLHSELGLVDNYVRSVLSTRDGSVWIGTAKGVSRWDGEQLHVVEVPWHENREGSVLAMAEDGDGVWLGTDNQGLIRIPHARNADVLRIHRENGLPANQVRSLLTARDGSVWIGTIAGMARLRPDGTVERIRSNSLGDEGIVRALHEDPQGGLWISTAVGIGYRSADGQLRNYDRSTTPAFPSEITFDFLTDPDGTVWIGTDSGLVRFHDGAFTTYGYDDGLPNESLFRILPADGDAFWLSSNRGVFRISRSQFAELDSGERGRLAPEIVDRADGMRSSQANGNTFPAGTLDRSGHLWIPTAEGVVTIDPVAKSAQQASAPRTIIESVSINGVQQRSGGAIHGKAREAGRVVFTYAGLNYRNIGNIVFRYRLDGVDEDWVDAGTSTEAVYTSLPAGHLIFQVEAIVRPDDWGVRQRVGTATLPLYLAPPFWESWPFRAAMFALFVAAFVLVQRASQMVHIRRQRILSRLVEQRTAELQEKNHALEMASLERQQLLEKLELQATHDELTGLPNRRAARRELARLVDQRRVLQVALVDADHFKHVNDTYGHDAGDRVLVALGDHLRDTVAGRGSCARLGGEEFVMILPDISQEEAQECCEALRAAVESSPVALPDGQVIDYTVSIGLSARVRNVDGQALLNQADMQTYRAKAAGRNRVCVETAVAQRLG